MSHVGSVVASYELFLAQFDSPRYELVHQPVSSRMELFYAPLTKRLLYPFYLFRDVAQLAIRPASSRPTRIVQVNPSLIPVSLIHDGCVIVLAKLLRRKVVVFFHGRKPGMVNYLRPLYCSLVGSTSVWPLRRPHCIGQAFSPVISG